MPAVRPAAISASTGRSSGAIHATAVLVALAAVALLAAALPPAAAGSVAAFDPASHVEIPAHASDVGAQGSQMSVALDTWSQSSTLPPRTTTFSAVSVGEGHSCALGTDGSIVCWGYNRYGQAQAPSGIFSAVSAGWSYSCGLKTDATITCWGDNRYGYLDAPSGTFSAVSAGLANSCAIRTDGTITCWGDNRYGYLDAPSGTFSVVSAGGGHNCAIRTDGTVACWGGANNRGELDAPSGTFSAVSAGSDHSCAIRPDGTVACWGYNSNPFGQAQAPSGIFSAASAGGRYSCGLKTDATITCWGDNRYGYLDAPSGTFSAVSVGSDYSCAIRTDGTVACWSGNSSIGQVLTPSGTFSAVTSNRDHTCALSTDGFITCWGYVGSWSLEDIWDIHTLIHTLNGTFSAVSAGGGHGCAIRTDGSIVCWGDNRYGQASAPSGTFSAVSAGWGHSCAINTDGSIMCWGDNRYGQADAPSGTFSAVSVGGRHNCAIRTDGTVACWGYNDASKRWPADAPSGTFSAVSARSDHSCAIRTDGTIACWGGSREDGWPEGAHKTITTSGDTVCSGSPDDGTRACSGHSCAIRTDGTITCWGSNSHGQAVSPSGTYSTVTAGSTHSCALSTGGLLVCWGSMAMRAAAPAGGSGSAPDTAEPANDAVTDEGSSEGPSAVDEGVPDGTPGGGEQVPGDPSVVVTDVGPGTVVDGLAKVSGLRYDFGAERAVWEPVSGAVSYLLAMWDGEQSRQLNVECCSYIIYLSQSDVEQINVRASNNSVNNPVEGPWSGWVSLLPERVGDLQYARRPAINLGLFTVALDDITWRPVISASAYDLEWSYSGAGFATILKRYGISSECLPRCRSYLVRRPATESRFRVRASNAAGKGPWSDWSTIRPERPAEVTGLRHDLAMKRFVWSRASGAATYVVRLWDGETGRNVEQDACCSYAIDAKRDGITHFAVRAANSGGSGPWSDWQRILENPGNPTGPKVERYGLSGLRVWWRAPIDSGSSPISHYEVQYTRGNWSRTYEADGHAHTTEGLVQGVEYSVELVSVNRDDLRSGGSGAYGTTASCPGGSRGAKYKKVVRRFRSDYFEAAQSFETVDGTRVTAGTKAGEIGDTSLSQSGCSWVFEDDASVESGAYVSENAIVRDKATVNDKAEVFGDAIVEDKARIFDDARVSGMAHVWDRATVRDHARVYGMAEVWGNDTEIRHYARVYGDARVWDGATVKDHARVYENAKVSDGAVIAGSGDNSDDNGVYAKIYGMAEVSGEAVVKGNAEVYDEAKVYGEAEVFGDAKVRGNARIYGEASVSGNANVYGEGKIFGDAKVSGYAHVFGTAKISDGMEVSCSLRLHDDVSGRLQYFSTSSLEALQPVHQECVYNGEFEFRRAALEVYFETRDEFVSTLTDCLNDPAEARRTTADLMAAPSNGVEIARQELGQEIVRGCSRLDEHRKIIREFTPGTVDIVVSYALGFLGTLRISTFTKSLIETADLANDLKSLSDAHAKLTAQIEKIREDR